ncbi:30S ribosomal protein S2 [Candidatus Woesearchaeota archaeon]|nr:30S ribosomal protein S2 [Nanoarchaeota archaeon]MCB9370392.1 30S ribosomal protein S2 [Candidatus Woesearchaeota archaeon]USN44910.1 MAG: 30S ribosomal protein S2 [Candidatus Woesearchaeota archaeon]
MDESTTLVPVDEYLTAGVHIGTKFKNGFTDKYVHRSRADGLKIMDTEKIDEKLKVLISLLSRYEPSEFVIMGRRENVKKPIVFFGKLVGCDVFTGRYLPGKLTNASLEDFKEYKVVMVCDPLTDRNILNEAFEQGVFTVGFCDTNNKTEKLDLVVPINNKGKKSMALALMLLAKHYLVNKGVLKESEFTYTLEDFAQE